MSDRRRVHDEAWQSAREVVAIFAPCLREEERLDAFREVYEVLKRRLQDFLVRRDRERLRSREGQSGPAPEATSEGDL